VTTGSRSGSCKGGYTDVVREKVAACHEGVKVEVKLNCIFSLTLDRNEWPALRFVCFISGKDSDLNPGTHDVEDMMLSHGGEENICT
jgi:hypothetical protein